ncbi:unnamed protein product [Camellia sinensis]
MMIRKKSALYCHADHVAPLDYGGRPVLSPNGMNRAESAAKELELRSGIGIVKFFREKKFLVTGGTWFLAKVLVEKILRTVPDVDRIYLTIKAENKEAATERLKDERLQQTYGESYQDFMPSKLVPVVGNVCKDNPALEEDVADAIKNEVDVIINSAANTNFDESTYVNGERQGRIIEKPMCIGDRIAEESSTSAVDVENEMKLVLNSKKCLEDKAVTPKMKEPGTERAKKYGWQNTYLFTKAMGEMLIDDTGGDIPLVIIRPGDIGSTDKEPFPGWIEGNRIADPLIRLYGKGQLSGFPGDPNGVLDAVSGIPNVNRTLDEKQVPADFVVNAILAATAKHGAVGKSESSTVYQVASSVINPLLVNETLAQLGYEYFNSMPCRDSMGRPIQVLEPKIYSSMEDFKSHLWTEAIQHSKRTALANQNGKVSPKPINIGRITTERLKYLAYLANIYQAYTCYGGRFDSSNTQRLMQCMREEERSKFGFDLASIDWKDYVFNTHIPGVRKHVMKEKRDV